MLGSLFAFGGCFGLLPMILAGAALIDSIRTGAGWYWCLIILTMPVIGPIAYFVVVRSPLLGSRGASFMSHSTARRLQARRRLRVLQVQLGHWRGPGVLVEAGEELLVLGKNKEAEAHFREAIENGAAVEDANYGLAQALQAQGRFADAVPYLEKLVAAEPDARLGEGPLALARGLDESGRRDEAEPVLRHVLERRTVIEAQVRLSRILLQKGEKEEAGKILAEVALDARALPSYLKRRHRGWLRAARGLRPGTSLPRPKVDGAITVRERLQVAGAAVAAVIALFLVGGYLLTTGSRSVQTQEVMQRYEEARQLRSQLIAFDRSHPWTRGGDLSKVDLTGEDVDRYLRVRRGLEPALREIVRQQAAFERNRRAASSSLGPVLTASSVSTSWIESECAFERSLLAELQREAMGPHELENLIVLIDGRFLRRLEAQAFAPPESAVDLSPASRSLLEGRRAEVEALDPGGLELLLRSLDPSMDADEE